MSFDNVEVDREARIEYFGAPATSSPEPCQVPGCGHDRDQHQEEKTGVYECNVKGCDCEQYHSEPPGAGRDPYGRPDPRTHPEFWTE